MKNMEQYLPVTISALAVILLGCMNPEFLRHSKYKGAEDLKRVNYMWLALAAFVAGVVAVWLQNQKGYEIL